MTSRAMKNGLLLTILDKTTEKFRNTASKSGQNTFYQLTLSIQRPKL